MTERANVGAAGDLDLEERRNRPFWVEASALSGAGLWWAYAVASGTSQDHLEVDHGGVLLTLVAASDNTTAQWVEFRKLGTDEDSARRRVIEHFGTKVKVPTKALLSLRQVAP